MKSLKEQLENLNSKKATATKKDNQFQSSKIPSLKKGFQIQSKGKNDVVGQKRNFS